MLEPAVASPELEPDRWPAPLIPLSSLYGAVVSLRGWLYDRGWLTAHRLPVPVVSVGNLTVGGTGKSPMVACVARRLLARGVRVAIVSRGYGGTRHAAPRVVSSGRDEETGTAPLLDAAEVGDEPVMLARLLEGVPVIVSRRRQDGGEMAVSRFGAGCVILDDGFQHRALARSLDLLLLDGTDPLGNGRLLPAGPLREPVAAMRRAGAIIVTRSDRSTPATLAEIERMVRRHASSAPLFKARTRAVALIEASYRGDTLPLDRLRSARVVCFAGIAAPHRFFDQVREAGARVESALPFPDHHRYTEADLGRVAEAAGRADLILTTEKDAARLAGWQRRVGGLKNLYALRVETILDDEPAFTALLGEAVPTRHDEGAS